MRHLVWLRADLRSVDNTALHLACRDDRAEVACVYAITPGQWRAHDMAGCRADFELRTLHTLQGVLARLNIPLLLVTCPDFAALPAALADLCRRHQIDQIFFNRQYEVNELARDAQVEAALSAIGVAVTSTHDQCAIAPGRIRTHEGRFYSVFTPFKRVWLSLLAQEGITVLPQPRARMQPFVPSDALPSHIAEMPSHLSADQAARHWPAGEDAALRRLQDFCASGLQRYAGTRDFPDLDDTSTLSPYLAVGAISVRQCLNAAFAARHQAAQGENDIDTWIAELGWRDFYKHIMAGFPRVCRHQPFQMETRALRWRHDEAAFQRWCAGQTGFPIIDAAMRQLQDIGWMHNRLRMLTAMFLTKDLFIDWRWGERFFMQHLIDGDLAANNGGWQWCASTGNDAAPYFRVFNPTLQSERFDPEGHFIRRYVPELGTLDRRAIHAPHASQQLGLFSTYPEPMVDHRTAKDFAIAQFQGLRPPKA